MSSPHSGHYVVRSDVTICKAATENSTMAAFFYLPWCDRHFDPSAQTVTVSFSTPSSQRFAKENDYKCSYLQYLDFFLKLCVLCMLSVLIFYLQHPGLAERNLNHSFREETLSQKVSTVYWISQDLSTSNGTNDWFSEREKAILEKLRFTKRRSDWRLGRFTAKEMIRRFLENQNVVVPFKEIEILPEADGSPKVFLKNETALFSISISHSHNRAFCVLNVSNRPIGCDLEYLEPRSENLVNDYFTENEMAFVRTSPPEQKNLATNLIWSSKESVLKALKEGLRLDTRSVNINIDAFVPGKIDWQNFTAEIEKSENYYGCWKQAGDFVYTIVNPQKARNLIEL